MFISYRRVDTGRSADRLYRTLSAVLGPDRLFKDIDDIPLGRDFRVEVADAIDRSAAMVVMIGPDWQGRRADGKQRIDRPNDFVRIEVERALAADLMVFPVLVDGGMMPNADDLPAAVADLSFRNALTLGDESWDEDVAPLVAALQELFDQSSPGLGDEGAGQHVRPAVAEDGLSLADRRLIAQQAEIVLGQNYVHRHLKRGMRRADPIQALKLLRHRLGTSTPSTMGSEHEFHEEMLRIFSSLGDFQARYVLPRPFATKIMYLPFDVERYEEDGAAHYLVSHVAPGFRHDTFGPGVEIVSWNGLPIAEAVEANAERYDGALPEARLARGLQSLTVLPAHLTLPPEDDSVTVEYVDLADTPRSLHMAWETNEPAMDTDVVDLDPANAACHAIDIEMDAINKVKRKLLAPSSGRTESKAEGEVPTTLPDLLRARSVTTSSGLLGHLRIFSFDVEDPDVFLAEVERLLTKLPQTMLAIDLRGNPGGHIHAGEGLLQLFTARPVTPAQAQFLATPLNARIASRHRADPVGVDLGPWSASLNRPVETGAVYSDGHPITPVEFANSRGQHYRGQVLCIVDGRCCSAAEMFVAGFVDHGIGMVVGVDGTTSATGANAWTHALLDKLLSEPGPGDTGSPYRTLPMGADMQIAMRRTLRVNTASGTPLEDLGIVPDVLHQLTRDDLLGNNTDLLEHAASLLATGIVRVLEPALTTPTGDVQPIDVTTQGFERLDIYVDGRPHGSVDVTDREPAVIEVPSTASLVRFEGWAGWNLVASARLELSEEDQTS